MENEYELRSRIARLEEQVDFLLRTLNLVEQERAERPPVDPLIEEVVMLVRQGKKINAIALYRRRTGVGLREAKEFVDSIG